MKKHLRDYINYNDSHLANSPKDLRTVFNLMFRCKESVIAETTENYRIRRYTYGEVEEQINRSAYALYQKIGATHEYVGLEMENGIEWIVAFWAILKSGNKPYLINCRHPLSLSAEITASLKIKHILGLSPTKLNADYIDYSEIDKKEINIPQDFDLDGLFENEIALSTSATSLHGVVCFYTGREISDQILNAKDILKDSKRMACHYKGSLKQLAFLPFYHVFGLFAVYFWFIFFGRTLVFLPDYSPKSILQTCQKHEVTHIFAVPMLWHTVEKELYEEIKKRGEKQEKKFYKGIKLCTKIQDIAPFLGVKLSQHIMSQVTDELFGKSVRFCISGGSYLKNSAVKLFNGIGYPLHNGYGMSEIGITSVELRHKASERNENSVGRPFSSVEYKISDKGTLLVKGKSICKRMMIDGKEIINDEWFDTGDIMECRNGNYYIKGRMNDVIIGSNGENINPDLLEQMFDLKYADRFSVLGLEKSGEEKLTIVVEISPAVTNEQLDYIINHIKEVNNSLPIASQISEFYFTYDSIASDGAIKVGRQYVIRSISSEKIKLIPFAEIHSHKKSAAFASSEYADRIKKIIASTLSVDESTITDGSHIIHDLGASSLEYFAVLLAIADDFGINNWSEKDTYCYTVKEFCDYLEGHLKNETKS